MGMIAQSDAGSKFYVDMEHWDVFEEGADGVFVLKRVDGRKERIAIDAFPDGAQLLFGNQHRIWDYVRQQNAN